MPRSVPHSSMSKTNVDIHHVSACLVPHRYMMISRLINKPPYTVPTQVLLWSVHPALHSSHCSFSGPEHLVQISGQLCTWTANRQLSQAACSRVLWSILTPHRPYQAQKMKLFISSKISRLVKWCLQVEIIKKLEQNAGMADILVEYFHFMQLSTSASLERQILYV